jgi:ribosomal protein S18 acetylase RimI-like enzyme
VRGVDARVSIRPATPGELEEVLALWREAEAVPGHTDRADALRRLLDTSTDGLLVAELDGRIVGTVIATWDGWRAGLYRLAVLPSERRRGVARALIGEGERRLREKGAARISVLAIASSEAPEIWRAAGYDHDGRVRRFVKNLVPLALMLLFLAASCGSSQHKQSAEPRLGLPGSDTAATTRTSRTSTSRGSSDTTAAVPRPAIRQWRIPFGEKRKGETAAYALRHYGVSTWRLDPKVIVEHVSVTPTVRAVYDTFSQDKPDVELHELPGVCSHFVIDRDGTIYQLASLDVICRHTVGLNDHAIGIEHVGETDADVLGDAAQMRSSLALTRWLRCRYGISMGNVIGHNESLSSRYHHERVASLRNQTHSDWRKADMDVYRAKLRKLPC